MLQSVIFINTLAWLSIFYGVFTVLAMSIGIFLQRTHGVAFLTEMVPFTLLPFIVFFFAIGYGLLQRKNWARIVTSLFFAFLVICFLLSILIFVSPILLASLLTIPGFFVVDGALFAFALFGFLFNLWVLVRLSAKDVVIEFLKPNPTKVSVYSNVLACLCLLHGIPLFLGLGELYSSISELTSSPFSKFVLLHLSNPLLFAYLLLGFFAVLASIGLLWKKNWAREMFIGIVIAIVVMNIVYLAYQAFLADFTVTLDSQTVSFLIVSYIALTIAFRLNSAKIRSQFLAVPRHRGFAD
ncbi:MAG: hypothetical protein AAF518_11585 [Spirochaetota bacterium]